ncbi:MAG: N-acetylmuramoyl-L-alanine amidase, partial [Calditrichia bacterium]|nr:N-acetylmuramoyl-L-alanine amidase [Calditrichia bacterium]
DGEIYVPVEDFIIYFNQDCGTDLAVKNLVKPETDVAKTEKDVQKTFANVKKVKIENRSNGILVNIELDKGLNSSEVGVEFRNDWLFIDLYKGKIDNSVISTYKPLKPVKEVKVYQHKELASIALLLEMKKWKREVWVEPDEKKVRVILIDEEYQIKEDDVAEKDSKTEAQDKLELEKQKWYIDTIIIDPGHGGKDPGAIGYKKLKEKNVILPIAKNLEKIIKKKMPGVKVLMTRSKDVFIPLKNRTKFANKNSGKLFISIHANSLKSRKVNGFETFFLGPDRGDLATEIVMKENSVIEFETKDAQKEYEGIKFIMATMAQNAYMHQSEYLARMVQEEMGRQMKSLHMKDRGVKQGNFWVLVGATMPNILVETGFISNKHDSKILKTKKYQLK